MKEIDEELEKVTKEYKSVKKKIEILEKCDIIKEYHKLLNDYAVLKQEQDFLYVKSKLGEYKGCNHLRICTGIHTDKNYKVQRNFGCIKCGIDTSVLSIPKKELSIKEQAMCSYLYSCSGTYLNGLYLNEICDISLATAVYKKIKDANPEASEEELIKYFKRALSYMRKDNVSKEREDNRIKRLELRPHFSCWDRESVITKD